MILPSGGINIFGRGTSIPAIHKVPDNINVLAGTETGTVTDVQNWQDGNFLAIQEEAATPALDVEFNFVNVESIRRIGIALFYQGSATHWLEVRLWNYTEEVLKVLFTIQSGLGFNYRYSDLPGVSDNDYIDENGNAKICVCHPSSGNVSHDAFFDYVGLIS